MAVDVKKFQRKGPSRPARTNGEFIEFQAKNGVHEPYLPIPIYNNEPHDRLNPVWRSIKDLNEYARRIPGFHAGIGYRSDEDDTSRQWSWGFNMNDCFALYDRGWHEGFDAVRTGMENAARAAMAKAIPIEDLEKHVAGSFVDVPSYIRGEPEAMYEFQDVTRDLLHLTVEVDSFIQWDTNANEILYRGVSVMSAVMALRRLGVFVTLVSNMTARSDLYFPKRKIWKGRGRTRYQEEVDGQTSNRNVTATVHLMNQDLTENLSEVLLFLCHPGYYRKVFFHAIASAWGINDSGIATQRRGTDDFFPKPGSGRVVIPGRFTSTSGEDDSGIDWGNTWASPKAAEMMVENMLKCAAPTHR
jgi:hypothetical protein